MMVVTVGGKTYATNAFLRVTNGRSAKRRSGLVNRRVCHLPELRAEQPPSYSQTDAVL